MIGLFFTKPCNLCPFFFFFFYLPLSILNYSTLQKKNWKSFMTANSEKIWNFTPIVSFKTQVHRLPCLTTTLFTFQGIWRAASENIYVFYKWKQTVYTGYNVTLLKRLRDWEKAINNMITGTIIIITKVLITTKLNKHLCWELLILSLFIWKRFPYLIAIKATITSALTRRPYAHCKGKNIHWYYYH